MKILSEEELELKFQERIDKGEIIEPTDWMPERYRKQRYRMKQDMVCIFIAALKLLE